MKKRPSTMPAPRPRPPRGRRGERHTRPAVTLTALILAMLLGYAVASLTLGHSPEVTIGMATAIGLITVELVRRVRGDGTVSTVIHLPYAPTHDVHSDVVTRDGRGGA